MAVCGEHEHDLMGSKKRAVNLTLRWGDIKLMSFQRSYRLITYECYDRLIGLARDYLTPKFIFLTTKHAGH